MATLFVPDRDLKGLRETLCVAQTMLNQAPAALQPHRARIEALISEVDRHRPLGPDGNHDNRHTPTCGCEDRDLCVNCGEAVALQGRTLIHISGPQATMGTCARIPYGNYMATMRSKS